MANKQNTNKNQQATIGIVGGGQLGRMIALAGHKRGHRIVVLSDQANSPACQVVEQSFIGDYLDEKILEKFCNAIDIATIEFENIPLQCAEYIARKVEFAPSVNILKITQHRLLEKNFLNSIAVKTTPYLAINNFDDLQNGLKNFKKAILKTALMGYDGKGQESIDDKITNQQLLEIYKKFDNTQHKTPLILEQFCKFDQEISVIVARNKDQQIMCYEPLTNIHKNGILYHSIYPAKINQQLKDDAKKIATKIANSLDLVGVLAVEFFVVDDQLLVNEMAPRPHNSGHFSMDACITSQFEQVIRSITNSTLGAVNYFAEGYMQNLLGTEIFAIDEYKKNPYAKIHIYGKDQAIEGRKMGHVNIIKN